jgi:ferredoxin
MGRCVGGSSVLTGAVCFRIPDAVLDEWQRDLGLDGLHPEEPRGRYVDTSRRPSTSRRCPSDDALAEHRALRRGRRARKGVEMKPIRRNTKGCEGCGRCNFGCPHGAKMSVDLSYLPRAVAAGATSGRTPRRAGGDEGAPRRRGRGAPARPRPRGPGSKLTVRAARVVIAAGAWHTPLLLLRSGIGHPRWVGRDDAAPGLQGARALRREGARAGRAPCRARTPTRSSARGSPSWGSSCPRGARRDDAGRRRRSTRERAASIDHLAMFGGIIHDKGGGRCYRGRGASPWSRTGWPRGPRADPAHRSRSWRRPSSPRAREEVFLPVLGMRGVDADAFREGGPRAGALGRRSSARRSTRWAARAWAARRTTPWSTPTARCGTSQGSTWPTAAILPTSLGVNPQLSIMTVATRIAWRMN